MGITTVYGAVHYWLVDHPVISQYEWKPGHTPGASPHFVAAALAAYLSLTFLLHRFPTFLILPSAAYRPIAILHNIVLCVLSVIMDVGMVLSVIHETPPGYPAWFICFPDGSTSQRGPTFFWGHVFYLSKVLEFVDTLLILWSGSRARRLTFLHVYHHTGALVMCYVGLEAAESLMPVAVVLNASVHVLMYGYYLMSAVGQRPGWKKLVTDCQIVQFLLGHLSSGLMLCLHFSGSGCSGIRAWVFNILYVTSLLVLFRDFHAKNYAQKKKKLV